MVTCEGCSDYNSLKERKRKKKIMATNRKNMLSLSEDDFFRVIQDYGFHKISEKQFDDDLTGIVEHPTYLIGIIAVHREKKLLLTAQGFFKPDSNKRRYDWGEVYGAIDRGTLGEEELHALLQKHKCFYDHSLSERPIQVRVHWSFCRWNTSGKQSPLEHPEDLLAGLRAFDDKGIQFVDWQKPDRDILLLPERLLVGREDNEWEVIREKLPPKELAFML